LDLGLLFMKMDRGFTSLPLVFAGEDGRRHILIALGSECLVLSAEGKLEGRIMLDDFPGPKGANPVMEIMLCAFVPPMWIDGSVVIIASRITGEIRGSMDGHRIQDFAIRLTAGRHE
jgi:hypothetical protein